jgi:hypothetical protein
MSTIPSSIFKRCLAVLCAAVALAAALHAPRAQARGHVHWGVGIHIGGPSYYRPYPYAAYPYSYYTPPPPIYYAPPAAYYPPTVYTSPQITYIEQPQNYITAPRASTPQLPLEQRLQRLRDMCAKGLFTAQECATRRQEILNEM